MQSEIIANYRRPNKAKAHNSWAWNLVQTSDKQPWEYDFAKQHAEKAVELEPSAGHIRNTLGVAYYRVGDFQGWIAGIEYVK